MKAGLIICLMFLAAGLLVMYASDVSKKDAAEYQAEHPQALTTKTSDAAPQQDARNSPTPQELASLCKTPSQNHYPRCLVLTFHCTERTWTKCMEFDGKRIGIDSPSRENCERLAMMYHGFQVEGRCQSYTLNSTFCADNAARFRGLEAQFGRVRAASMRDMFGCE